jgi:nucleoside-diphosphate-sugar epimerase
LGRIVIVRILLLGGTWFLGPALIADAAARGWDVTVFNRGRSGPDPAGVTAVHGDRTSTEDLRRLARGGRWDAVVDSSSSQLPPRNVLLAAEALRASAARWVHISTVSVYAGWPNHPLREGSALLDCPPDADGGYGHDGPDGSPTRYGFQKAGGERAVLQHFGRDAVLLRPGVILGPGEYVGRLPWWLRRARRGGPMLAPGPAGRLIQPIDVRDVAAFALDRAGEAVDAAGAVGAAEVAGAGGMGGVGGTSSAEGMGGAEGLGEAAPGQAYNLAHPQGATFAGFLRACLAASGGRGRPLWAPPELLRRHSVRQWTELPLWRTHPGTWSVDPSRAVAAGLRCRPLAQTAAETWAWLCADGRPVPHPRWHEHGIAPEKEARILAELMGGGAEVT